MGPQGSRWDGFRARAKNEARPGMTNEGPAPRQVAHPGMTTEKPAPSGASGSDGESRACGPAASAPNNRLYQIKLSQDVRGFRGPLFAADAGIVFGPGVVAC